MKAVVDMKGRMNVIIGGRTENKGGVVNVARTVVSSGEDTALFALFHEIGHGVQTEGDIPDSVKLAIYDNQQESGARYGELFADAFAAIALSASGRSSKQIIDGAQGRWRIMAQMLTTLIGQRGKLVSRESYYRYISAGVGELFAVL